jgi:hypothetical protein
MKLSEQVNQLHNSIIETISSLLEGELATPITNYSTKGLDLRCFSLDSEAGEHTCIELLTPTGNTIDFIDCEHAYCSNGLQYDIHSILAYSLEEICRALDTLQTFGLPIHRVVLRATIKGDDSFFDGQTFDFGSDWTLYDSSSNDGETTFRLDSIVDVVACTSNKAIKAAIEAAPPLGDFDDMCHEEVSIQYWVDDKQDDVSLI